MGIPDWQDAAAEKAHEAAVAERRKIPQPTGRLDGGIIDEAKLADAAAVDAADRADWIAMGLPEDQFIPASVGRPRTGPWAKLDPTNCAFRIFVCRKCGGFEGELENVRIHELHCEARKNVRRNAPEH